MKNSTIEAKMQLFILPLILFSFLASSMEHSESLMRLYQSLYLSNNSNETELQLANIFEYLKYPININYKGSADSYRKTLFEEAEALVAKEPAIKLPVDGMALVHGETFLYRAAQYNVPLLLEKFIETSPKSFTGLENRGKALWQAALQGNAGAVNVLLQSEVNACWQNNTYVATPLHKAAFQGHLETVMLFIEYSKKNQKPYIFQAMDSDRKTPLDYAREKQSGNEVVIALLEQAKNKNSLDNEVIKNLWEHVSNI